MPAGNSDISSAGSDLRSAAITFSEVADAPGASESFPAALTHIEEGLRAVSESVYRLARDAVPAKCERNRVSAHGREQSRLATEGRLSREQEAHLAATMHELAQDFNRCARCCAKASDSVQPLITPPKPPETTSTPRTKETRHDVLTLSRC